AGRGPPGPTTSCSGCATRTPAGPRTRRSWRRSGCSASACCLTAGEAPRRPPGARRARGKTLMDEHLEANRTLWDAWTRINLGSRLYDVEAFAAGGGRDLDPIARAGPGDVRGRSLLHL